MSSVIELIIANSERNLIRMHRIRLGLDLGISAHGKWAEHATSWLYVACLI